MAAGTSPLKKVLLVWAAILLIAVYASAADRREGVVRWVIDGDTFELGTGERVRLIGIDTPEYQPWKNKVQYFGREAGNYSRSLLRGKRVLLEEDAVKKDRYGRTLAYVYLNDGALFVNQNLVEEGYARAKYFPPNGRYYSLLKDAEQRAKKEKKGFWAPAKKSRTS